MLRKNRKINVPFAKPRRKSHKKQAIGIGLASAVIAGVVGAIAHKSDQP
jgi:hypothetical protein